MDTPNDTPSVASLGDNIRPMDRLTEITDPTERAKVFAQRLDDSLVSTYLLARSPEFAKLSGFRQKASLAHPPDVAGKLTSLRDGPTQTATSTSRTSAHGPTTQIRMASSSSTP